MKLKRNTIKISKNVRGIVNQLSHFDIPKIDYRHIKSIKVLEKEGLVKLIPYKPMGWFVVPDMRYKIKKIRENGKYIFYEFERKGN